MKKILVIDDDPNIVELLKSRLTANQFDVRTAKDGQEGLRKVEASPPDLIILDILMPHMDGFTFVRALKRLEKKIPVIVLTAKDKMRDLFELEGIHHYIVKPYHPEDLLKRIHTCLDSIS